jgi:acyl-CoA dehydrogenase
VLTLPSRSIFTDDHEAFRDSVRRFATTEIVPHLDDWRRGAGMPRTLVAAAGEAGFLGTAVPEEFGGGGTDDMGFLAVLIEEMVAAGATCSALLWALHAGVAIPCLLHDGSDADKDWWLPGLASGELIGIPAARGSVTLQDGCLTGVLSGVPWGCLADLLFVDLGEELPGIAVIAVEQPGVTVTPVAANLAGDDAALADVSLNGVGVNAVVPASEGFRRDLDLWFAVIALAGARAAVALALEYVHARKVFGRPLAEFENTRFRLAELSAELAAATTYIDECLATRSRGVLEATGAAAARLITAALHDRAVDQGLQLHGGYGYMREYPIAQAFANARFLRLASQLHSDPRHALAEGLGL